MFSTICSCFCIQQTRVLRLAVGSMPGKNLSTAANGGWQQRFSFFPLCISCLIRGPLSSFPLHYVSLVLLCLILAHRVCECVCVEREVQRALGGHQRLSERIKDPANLGKLGTRTHSLSLSAKSFLARILATSVLSFVSVCVFSYGWSLQMAEVTRLADVPAAWAALSISINLVFIPLFFP